MEIKTKMAPKLYFQTDDGTMEAVGKCNYITDSVLHCAEDPGFYAKDILSKNSAFTCSVEIEGLDRIIGSMTEYVKEFMPTFNIICTSQKIQRRTHRKRRINKKWAKRYGYDYVDVQSEPIMMIDNSIYVTHDGYETIKNISNKYNRQKLMEGII